LFKKGEVAPGAALVLRGHVEMEGSNLPASGSWELILEEALSGTNVIIPTGDIRAQTDATVLLILRSDLEALMKKNGAPKSLPSSAPVSPSHGSTRVSTTSLGRMSSLVGVGGGLSSGGVSNGGIAATVVATSIITSTNTPTTPPPPPQHVLSLSSRSIAPVTTGSPTPSNLAAISATPDQISISVIALGGTPKGV
jgi:hypothetical protein